MSLRVDLNGTATGFEQMLNKAKSQATAFSNSVEHEVSSSWGNIGKQFAASFAGMFTVEGVKSGVEWFIETGKQIKETAEQVDMSTDSWQKWKKAVDDAGLSTEGLSRVIESLRQKRTDALTDPKARGDLTRLGFSDADITGGMDMSTFMQRALQNASGGDLQRSYLANVIGQRGLKYASALGNLQGESADFSPDDIEAATQAAKVLIHVGRAIGSAGVKAVNIGRDFWHMFTWSQRDWEIDAMKRGLPLGKYADADLLAQQAKKPAIDRAAAIAALAPTPATVDPMDAKLKQQADEMAIHDQERQQRLLDSRRSLMTIGNRRASIAGEMASLQKQIADRNAKMNGEDFLTDAQKDELAGVTGKARTFAINALRDKYQDETDNLQVRFNKDKGDLREKPLDQKVTPYSKLGLYDEADAHINWDLVKMHIPTPEAREAQTANALLKTIAENTSPTTNRAHIQNASILGRLSNPHSP